MGSYAILGIHNKYNAAGELIRKNDTARVRMFIGLKSVDEDFLLPDLDAGIPETQMVFQGYIKTNIQARIDELEKGK